MKIKCVKLECEVCSKVTTIQLFYRSNGELAYGRARHYIGKENNKPQIEYHKQSLEYLQSILRELSDVSQIDHKCDLLYGDLRIHSKSVTSDGISTSDTELNGENWSWGRELNPNRAALQATA